MRWLVHWLGRWFDRAMDVGNFPCDHGGGYCEACEAFDAMMSH